MVVVFAIFIIILFIVLYNALIWLHKREQKLQFIDADEIGNDGSIREGLKVKKPKDPFKEISNAFKKIPDGFKKAQKEASKGFNKLGNTVKKETTGAFNKVGGEVKKAANEAKKASKKLEGMIKKEMNGIFKKLKKEITGPFTKIQEVFNRITCFFTGIGEVFIVIGNYFACGVEKIVSMPSCFLYYFLDIIYNIFIALPIWFFTLIFPPLKQVVNMVYKFMMQIDSAAYKSTGYHVFRYQEKVLDRCYRCKGLTKIPNIAERCFSKKKKKVEIKKSSDYCGIGAPASAKKECAALKHTAIKLSDTARTRVDDARRLKTKLEEKVKQSKIDKLAAASGGSSAAAAAAAAAAAIKTKTITEDEIAQRISYDIGPLEITIEKNKK